MVRALRRASRRQFEGGRMLYLTTRMLSLFRREEDGQDLLEYALLVALIAIVAVAAVTAAGAKGDAIFKDLVTEVPSDSRHTPGRASRNLRERRTGHPPLAHRAMGLAH